MRDFCLYLELFQRLFCSLSHWIIEYSVYLETLAVSLTCICKLCLHVNSHCQPDYKEFSLCFLIRHTEHRVVSFHSSFLPLNPSHNFSIFLSTNPNFSLHSLPSFLLYFFPLFPSEPPWFAPSSPPLFRPSHVHSSCLIVLQSCYKRKVRRVCRGHYEVPLCCVWKRHKRWVGEYCSVFSHAPTDVVGCLWIVSVCSLSSTGEEGRWYWWDCWVTLGCVGVLVSVHPSTHLCL